MPKNKGPKYWRIYRHMGAAICSVSDAEAGAAIKAACRIFSGEDIVADTLPSAASIVFSMLRESIDESHQDYSFSVESGKKGGNPNLKTGEPNPYIKAKKDKGGLRDGNQPLTGANPIIKTIEEEYISFSCPESPSSDTGTKEKKRKPTYPASSNEYQLASFLADSVCKNFPKVKKPTEKDIQSWADAFNKCHRIDNRPWEDIEAILIKSQEDEFWRGNIRSGGKFRKQYDELIVRLGV